MCVCVCVCVCVCIYIYKCIYLYIYIWIDIHNLTSWLSASLQTISPDALSGLTLNPLTALSCHALFQVTTYINTLVDLPPPSGVIVQGLQAAQQTSDAREGLQ